MNFVFLPPARRLNRREREEEAAEMLPRTHFGRSTAPLLSFVFAASLFAVTMSHGFLNDPEDAKPADVLEQSRPYTQLALSRYLGASNTQVAVGHDNWLFYQLGVQHLVGPGFLSPDWLKSRRKNGSYPDPRTTILNFRVQLRERGIQLILLPVPDKAAIYPEKLWPGYDAGQPAPENASFGRFKREMRAQGVLVFDPTELFLDAKASSPEPLYVPTDTHWTPRCAQLCAQALAAWIKGCVPLPERPAEKYSIKNSTASSPRDLVNLLGLPTTQDLYNFPQLPVREVHEAAGAYARPKLAADVLILGDSYSGSYAQCGASFGAQLAFELRRPIDNVAVPNGGSWGARFKLRDLMAKGEDHLAGKKLVIWEFAARDLSSGNWMPCRLPDAPDHIRKAADERR
jgi:alginate O-acetyltransferase complex protein AlgJ